MAFRAISIIWLTLRARASSVLLEQRPWFTCVRERVDTTGQFSLYGIAFVLSRRLSSGWRLNAGASLNRPTVFYGSNPVTSIGNPTPVDNGPLVSDAVLKPRANGSYERTNRVPLSVISSRPAGNARTPPPPSPSRSTLRLFPSGPEAAAES